MHVQLTESNERARVAWEAILPYLGAFIALLGMVMKLLSVQLEKDYPLASSLVGEIGMNLFPIGVVTLLFEYLQKKHYIGAIETTIRDELRSNIEPVIEHMTDRMISQVVRHDQPLVTHTREEMYKLGTDIILAAHRRLCIIQKTPSLLFGDRPYDSDVKLTYETEFNKALHEWINTTIDRPDRECLYLYCPHSARQEMENEHLQETVKKRMKEYKRIEQLSGSRFRITSVATSFSGPIALGDNTFAIWIRGEENAVCISTTNKMLADSLWQILKQMASRITREEKLLLELGVYLQ